MVELGSLETKSLKDVFKKGEASGFTPWLCDNINVLSDVLQLDISSPQRERSLDSLRVDIVAYTGKEEDKRVIIENQFGVSNSDHLGKLLSYAAYTGAAYAVWIVEKAREEHVKAIELLNSSCAGCFFFLVEAKVYQIDGSLPAISMSVVSSPEGDYGKVGESNLSTTEQRLQDFWTEFLAVVDKEKLPINRTAPPKDRWYTIRIGTSNIHYDIFVRKQEFSVQLVIQHGSNDVAWNKSAFDALESHREEIEAAFGEPLIWRRMTERISCIISTTRDNLGGYTSDKSSWGGIIKKMLETYERLSAAMRPHLKTLT